MRVEVRAGCLLLDILFVVCPLCVQVRERAAYLAASGDNILFACFCAVSLFIIEVFESGLA